MLFTRKAALLGKEEGVWDWVGEKSEKTSTSHLLLARFGGLLTTDA